MAILIYAVIGVGAISCQTKTIGENLGGIQCATKKISQSKLSDNLAEGGK
jgi:hypothetical protein